MHTVRTTLSMLLLLGAGTSIAQNFTLRSADLGGQATQAQVYDGFGCTGGNLSPQLSWDQVPEGTKSFAVTMYDPDAPTGSGWWHWVVFDLPKGTTAIPAGAGDGTKGLLPPGALQGNTDFGTSGYGGPCPPPGHGPHRYIITVHALDVESLGLKGGAGAALVGYMLGQHTLGKASLVFYHQR